MGDRTFPNLGDDLHVLVGVQGESGLRLDGVVIPDAQLPPVHPIAIGIGGEGKVVLGVQPAVIVTAELRKGTYFNHAVLHLKLIAMKYMIRA